MRSIIVSSLAFLISAGIWGATDAQARPPQPQGSVYIYPDGTLGYYVGQYRSNYYYVPPVNTGFYGPPSNSYWQGWRNSSPRGFSGNSNSMNYPGFYYQQNWPYWMQR